MSEKILVPVLGESLNEATVSKWLKNKGDSVNADEAIVELETDKVNLEVPAAVSGVLSEINSNEGDTVQVGTVLGIISDSKVEIGNAIQNGCDVISGMHSFLNDEPNLYNDSVKNNVNLIDLR